MRRSSRSVCASWAVLSVALHFVPCGCTDKETQSTDGGGTAGAAGGTTTTMQTAGGGDTTGTTTTAGGGGDMGGAGGTGGTTGTGTETGGGPPKLAPTLYVAHEGAFAAFDVATGEQRG